MTTSKTTSKQKRRTLARYAEILVMTGYDISDLFATPLSHFNYEVIEGYINQYEEMQEQGIEGNYPWDAQA